MRPATAAWILAFALGCSGRDLGAQGPAARPASGPALTDLDPAFAFLAPHGLQNFPLHYIEALQALLAARSQYWAEEYGAAQATLAALWARHPPGSPRWELLPTRPFVLFLPRGRAAPRAIERDWFITPRA